MAKIILNNEEFNFMGYSRNMYFNEASMTSNAYISDLRGENVSSRLEALAQDTITSIAIEVEGVEIYSLTNLNAKISSVDESFNGADTIITNLNLQFN